MTAYPAWTPASRPGIIPLHPLSFGTILGSSFTALRQNPRVLLGFALVVQTVAYLIVLVAIGGVAFATFARLDTLRPGTEEFETILIGSIAITAIASLVLGLAAGALGVLVQAIVVTEVAHAAVAEKLRLGQLWQRVKPVAWRLIGYTALILVVIVGALAIVALVIVSLALVAVPVAVILGILIVLGMIPLAWWLTIKLLLVPAVILMEQATIGRAIGRSWRLTKGRFWPALGVIFLISLVFGAVGQVISIPFTFLSSGLTTIISPTGDPAPAVIIGTIVTLLLAQVLTLLIQAVAVVVTSTATALIYIDARMRPEGLDLDLMAYVEQRDAGATGLGDPYRAHIGREIAPRAAAPAPVPGAAPYPPSAGYPGAGYTAPGATYAPPAGYAPAAAPAPPAPEAPAAPTPDPAPESPAAPAPTQWAAPGTSGSEAPRE